MSNITNAQVGLYPGSDHRFDSLFAQNTQAIVDLNLAAPTLYSGAETEVEGTPMASEAGQTMYQVLNLPAGEPSPRVLAKYVEDTDAANFNTDLTDYTALARNARYADQVGNM